jgi:hypothetical protein
MLARLDQRPQIVVGEQGLDVYRRHWGKTRLKLSTRAGASLPQSATHGNPSIP